MKGKRYATYLPNPYAVGATNLVAPTFLCQTYRCFLKGQPDVRLLTHME